MKGKKIYVGIILTAAVMAGFEACERQSKNKSGAQHEQGIRPYDYGYAKWVSEEPDIWFVTYGEWEDDPYWDVPEGVIRMGNRLIPFEARFDDKTGVVFVLDDGEDDYSLQSHREEDASVELLCGECSFSPDVLKVWVSDKKGLFYRGEKLSFQRVGLQENEQDP